MAKTKKTTDSYIEDQIIADMWREHILNEAEADRQHNNRMRSMYMNEISNAIDKGMNPSYLFPLIKKAGFNPSALLDEVLHLKTEKQRNELKNIYCQQIKGVFEQKPNATLEQITFLLRNMTSKLNMDLDESLVAEAYNDAKRNIKTKYQSIVDKASSLMAKDLKKGLQYIDEKSDVKNILACLNKTLESLIDEAKSKALKIKKSEGEAEYKNIVNEASSLMAKDLKKGLQYIDEKSDVKNILACLNKTLESLIDEAKSKALIIKKSERKNKISDMSSKLETLKDDVKDSKKRRNYLICSSVVLLLLGIWWSSVLLCITAIGLGVYTFFDNKKITKKSQDILEIQARLLELENEEVILV